jgi:hypothetical protein
MATDWDAIRVVGSLDDDDDGDDGATAIARAFSQSSNCTTVMDANFSVVLCVCHDGPTGSFGAADGDAFFSSIFANGVDDDDAVGDGVADAVATRKLPLLNDDDDGDVPPLALYDGIGGGVTVEADATRGAGTVGPPVDAFFGAVALVGVGAVVVVGVDGVVGVRGVDAGDEASVPGTINVELSVGAMLVARRTTESLVVITAIDDGRRSALLAAVPPDGDVDVDANGVVGDIGEVDVDRSGGEVAEAVTVTVVCVGVIDLAGLVGLLVVVAVGDFTGGGDGVVVTIDGGDVIDVGSSGGGGGGTSSLGGGGG